MAAQLQNAVLSGAYLSMAELTYTDLEQADLSGAHLEWAELEETNLIGTNLTRAHMKGTRLQSADIALDGNRPTIFADANWWDAEIVVGYPPQPDTNLRDQLAVHWPRPDPEDSSLDKKGRNS